MYIVDLAGHLTAGFLGRLDLLPAVGHGYCAVHFLTGGDSRHMPRIQFHVNEA